MLKKGGGGIPTYHPIIASLPVAYSLKWSDRRWLSVSAQEDEVLVGRVVGVGPPHWRLYYTRPPGSMNHTPSRHYQGDSMWDPWIECRGNLRWNGMIW